MVVSARKLWFEILNSQIETGTPYMLFKVFTNSNFFIFTSSGKTFDPFSMSRIPAIGKVTSRIWVQSSPQTCALRLLSSQVLKKLQFAIWHPLLYHDMSERRWSSRPY